MLLISNLLLLLVNAITFRREYTILFNRVAIFILLYSGIIGHGCLYVTCLDTGIGIYNGLFHSTAITHSFDLFIYIIAPIILLLTGFYARRIVQPIISYNRFESKNGLFSKGYVKAYRNAVMGLDAPQFTILEYPLIILFILIGAILLMSSSDLVSMFLAIELQSYGLYIFATLYRNSEWSTSGGLTYFLLGGPNRHKKSYIFCLQLSNSGDSLKLLVPSHNWKIVGGWINHSWMVTSQKMLERKMGYRGSKSVEKFEKKATVKEQRVDGSLSFKLQLSGIKCTLMGFERNYQIRILSNQINFTFIQDLYRSWMKERNAKKMSYFLLTQYTGSYFYVFKNNLIKMWEQFRIIEFVWIILFILIGQIFLIQNVNSFIGYWVSSFFIDPFLLATIIPIKIYSNVEENKGKILKENKNKSGVYMFTNLINGKQYIGSSINLAERFSFYYSTTYMEDALKKGISHIYRALLKNDYSNFSLTILEYCSPEQCIEREDFYFCSLPHEYNILPKAGSRLGHKLSDETKTIMSARKKGENHPNYGKTLSDEIKTKISVALTGEKNPMYGKPKAEGAGNPSQAIEVTDIKNNTTISYDSMREAARALNLPSHSIISHYILYNRKKPYKGQYTFKKL